MRVPAAIFVVLCCFGATAVRAYDAPAQPLTRAGCEQAAFVWDDNANVCDSDRTLSTRQPLTREACARAGETWDDNAQICDVALEARAVDVAAPVSDILIRIDKAEQKMVVWVDGIETYSWPVSTGRPGYSTPSGDYTPGSMNEIWYSRQWDNAPMPHAIFFTKRGHAIHGSTEVNNLGSPASHGCVRLAPKNAEALYQLVAENGLDRTKIVLAGLTPGGDYVSPGANAGPRTLAPVEDVQPKRRGGLFKRLFGRR